MNIKHLIFGLTCFGISSASAQIPMSEYAQRRSALAATMSDGTLIAFGSQEPAQDYISFYQNSPFYYLTGFKEPGATLVLRKKGTVVTQTLFVEPLDPSREVWTGRRLGPAGATRALGIPARVASQLKPYLDSLLASDSVLYMVGDFATIGAPLSPNDQFIDALKTTHTHLDVHNANRTVDNLRRVKSAGELDFIRKAVDITVIAEREAMRAMQPGVNEFEIQALIEYTFRRNGADRPSFSTITGSGPNSTTLHYNVDDRFIQNGDVVVMDIGASYRGYAADVTRTIPANGKFSKIQRDIYQLVRDAQAAAERQAKVNTIGHLLSDSANATMAAGLTRLGLMTSPDGTYDCDSTATTQCRQLTLYYMHGLGHGIGLDVHDPGAASSGRSNAPLVPGSAFTIEPGIYVRENLLDIIPETQRNHVMKERIRSAVDLYKNIGVRIEDDYIVTANAVEWISRAPREISEVEAAMRENFNGPLPRNPSIVDWYRATATRGSAQPSGPPPDR